MFGIKSLLAILGSLALSAATGSNHAAHARHAIQSRTTSPTPMTNGNTMVYAKVGNMTYDASGILSQGCTTSTISTCYTMTLASNASANLDTEHLDSPRQRNEWHFPTVTSGQTFSYSWKQYLDPATGSSTHFFYLMQVFGVPENGPVVALSALSNKLTIVDALATSCGSACPSTPLSGYLGVYTTHRISGMTGPAGYLNYTVSGPTGTTITSYSRTGGLGQGDAYIKFGTYRLTFTPNMTPVNTLVGDWQTYI